MQRLLRLLTITTLALFATFASAGTATAAADTGARTATSFAFALLTPNTASSPSGGMMAQPGDWISVTGGGTFQPAAGTVHAGGSFVHHRADGTVHCQGTWTATALTGWTDLGRAPGARRYGTVSMLVTHYCTTMGETHTGIPMTVTSAPRHSGTGATTGVTVGEFTEPTGGAVVILAGR